MADPIGTCSHQDERLFPDNECMRRSSQAIPGKRFPTTNERGANSPESVCRGGID